MKHNLGKTLKKCRLDANKTIKEISDLLISKGFKASEKTIYSWENGNSKPSPDAFLIMCKDYGITDVLGVFGYSEENHTNTSATLTLCTKDEDFTKDELSKIEEYKRLLIAARAKE